VRRTISRHVPSLSDLRLARVGVVGDRDPVRFGDLVDQRPDRLALLDADRELDALAVEGHELLVVLKPAVGADHDLAVMAGTANPREELLDEPAGARCVFAFPLRLRMCRTSPLSARTARIG